MSSNNPYDAVPEIDFAPESTEQILSDMVDTYEQSIFEQTGRMEKLPVASREKIILNTMAYLISELYQDFGNRAKMNLPKYSAGSFLDVLASFWGLTRRAATPAIGEVEFTLSAVREEDIFIPKGTRISPGDKLFFQTDEDLIIRSPAAGWGLPASRPARSETDFQKAESTSLLTRWLMCQRSKISKRHRAAQMWRTI